MESTSSASTGPSNTFDDKLESDSVLELPRNGGTRRVLVVISMAFLWTASQIPLFFYGGVEPQILESVGGYKQSTWIGLGYLLPLGIITPFVGALADLFGRKNVASAAFGFLIIGTILMSCATSMNMIIAGAALTGVGGGMGELVGLAVVGEIVPTKQRGLYMGAVHLSILPFAPSVLYAQLIARAATWRWCGMVIAGWSFVGLILMLVFYRPAPRNTGSKRELARRIDYVGGMLSAAGLTLFLLGLVFASEGVSWTSGKVLAPFLIGVVVLAGFVVWECKTKHPMFPRRLGKNSRGLVVVLVITFASGANYFATLLFWPTQYQALYAQDNAVSAGIGSLPTGFGIIIGGMIGTLLVSLLKKQINWLMVFCTALMTAANGAMACGRLDNLTTLWPIVSLACIGVGLTIVPNQVIAGIICPTDLIATITAATISVRIIGGAVAYAVYWNVFGQHLRTLAPVVASTAASVGVKDVDTIIEVIQAGGLGQIATTLSLNETQADAILRVGKIVSAESYSQVYFVSIAFGAVAFFASFFLTGVDKEMDDTVGVRKPTS